MALSKTNAAVLCAALLAGGCSFAEEALFPSMRGDDAGDQGQSVTVQPSAPAQAPAAPPALGRSSFEPPSVTPGSPTGTFVGQKVTSLRNDLQQLQGLIAKHNSQLQSIRNETVQDSQRYHGTVAAINARLQVGTTPGNPVLMQQWNSAQQELSEINEDVAAMNRLATEVASASAFAAYLLDSVQAARGLSGAVDEDHRQLRILEDEVGGTIVLIERLLTELASDVSRQQQYVANERNNLNTLAVAIKNGQLYGSSLVSRMPASPQLASVPPEAAAAGSLAGERPLVVIRFDRPNVSYETALYTAVKAALDRRPAATFDVVAVSPTRGSPGQAALSSTTARRNAESVVRSLSSMGLPTNRIRLSALNSDAASTGEVHVFVR